MASRGGGTVRRIWKALATAAGLVAVLAGVGSASGGTGEDGVFVLVGRDDRRGSADVGFVVNGTSVRGLYPGATKTITLRVRNPYPFKLTVDALGGKVVRASRRGCAPTAANVVVNAYRGKLPITVGPHSDAVLPGGLPIVMPSGASPKCSATSFDIALRGHGKKAAR